MDLAHECLSVGYQLQKNIVSILVLVDLAHEFHINLSAYLSISVSILVLVDLAHEFASGFLMRRRAVGFNPCFSGSCSRIFQ